MPVESGLLELCRCPNNGSALRLMSDDALSELNGAILVGKVSTVAGDVIDKPLSEALVREDGQRVYRVLGDEGIPVLIEAEAIVWPVS